MWFLKCKAINEKNWLDDTEMEEEGIAEMLMDDNAIAQLPRYSFLFDFELYFNFIFMC